MNRRFLCVMLAICGQGFGLTARAEPIFLKRCATALDGFNDTFKNRSDPTDMACTLPKVSATEAFDPRIANPASSQMAIALATEQPNLKPGRRMGLSFKTSSYNGQAAAGLSGIYVLERGETPVEQTALFAGAGVGLSEHDVSAKFGLSVKW